MRTPPTPIKHRNERGPIGKTSPVMRTLRAKQSPLSNWTNIYNTNLTKKFEEVAKYIRQNQGAPGSHPHKPHPHQGTRKQALQIG